MRYRCLDRTAGKLMLRPDRACSVIMVCFLLHNLARRSNFYGQELPPTPPMAQDEDSVAENDQRGQEIRAQLIVNNFN